MAPKPQPNAQKAATILAWFQKTAQAHSIKDLEKILPQVASISGMQVKDYLQALSDDSKIRVEKIGSGNWYWSFPSDEKKAKETAICKAREEHLKANTVVAELQAKANEAAGARAKDEGMILEFGNDRETLIATHEELSRGLDVLRMELAVYSAQDPVEMERRSIELQQFKLEAERRTDQILDMEAYLKELSGGMDRNALLEMLQALYKEEYDEEEQALREL